jgi:hypothetical protein
VLQGVARSLLEPGCFAATAPVGQALGHGDIADELPAGFVVGLLQCQSLVVDKSARSGKAAHVALLRPVGHQLEFEGLQALHTGILSSSCE